MNGNRGSLCHEDLYKLILPTGDVPNLAFLGRILSTCDIVTSFVQAEWLAALLAGKFSYPSREERKAFAALLGPEWLLRCCVDSQWLVLCAEIRRYRAWRLRFTPKTTTTFLATPSVHAYFDELLWDLSDSSSDLHSGSCVSTLLEQFLPLRASRYAKLRQRNGTDPRLHVEGVAPAAFLRRVLG